MLQNTMVMVKSVKNHHAFEGLQSVPMNLKYANDLNDQTTIAWK